MITAPIPTNEEARLADLHALHILDTPGEERFDRLIALTKRSLGTSVAMISLVDKDRQWFKSSCGMGCKHQTPRGVSFCGHAIVNDGPLIVPDAKADERFVDNPLVVGPPHIRFYAGFPLKGPGGHKIGTLCVADSNPRAFSDRDRALMTELAEMAEYELNLVTAIEAQRRYMQTQQHLNRELRDAAEYVRSQLPEPLDHDRGVSADYVYISSSQLGGDMLGYHALDENQIAMYVLDVTGHGVGASLLSVSVQQGVRQNNHRFEPARLLESLNRAFPMEEHHNKFITLWYGIYDRRDRSLRYATAGHPPAALLLPGAGKPTPLGQPHLMLGAMNDTTYTTETLTLPPGSRLYLYSDGAYEITSDRNSFMGLEGLMRVFSSRPPLEAVLRTLREFQGLDQFTDDLSLVQMDFD